MEVQKYFRELLALFNKPSVYLSMCACALVAVISKISAWTGVHGSNKHKECRTTSYGY
jgi:hypothetical protein